MFSQDVQFRSTIDAGSTSDGKVTLERSDICTLLVVGAVAAMISGCISTADSNIQALHVHHVAHKKTGIVLHPSMTSVPRAALSQY